MPNFLGLPAGSNPLAVTHGHPAVLNQRNYKVLTQWSIDRTSPFEFANLTTLTRDTVLGMNIAQQLGYRNPGPLHLYLCNPAGLGLQPDRHRVDVIPIVSPDVDPDYFQLGWESMENYFVITEVASVSSCVLTAKDPSECQP
jgi:hypothetical protein